MNTPDLKASKLDCIQRMFSGNKPYFISLKLIFNRQPDLIRIQKAVSLLSEALPILSADFDNNAGGWDFTYRKIEITKFSGSTDDTVEYLNNLTDESSPFCVLYIQKSNTLIITVDHTITDAHGLLGLAKMLCTAYRKLEINPKYKIPEHCEKRILSLTENMTEFSKADCIEICGREISVSEKVKPWQKYLAPIESCGDKYQFRLRQIDPDKFSSAKAYAKKYGATVNDLIRASFAVSLQKLIRENTGVEIQTVPIKQANDLRKYLPEELRTVIGNFSVPCWSPVECVSSSDFSEILKNTAEYSHKLKKHPTAPGILFAVENPENSVAQTLIAYESSPSAALSNTGIIPLESVDFGEELKVTDALLYADFRFGNPYYLIASTYENTLSLVIITKSAGEEYAEKILDEVQNIIQGLAE